MNSVQYGFIRMKILKYKIFGVIYMRGSAGTILVKFEFWIQLPLLSPDRTSYILLSLAEQGELTIPEPSSEIINSLGSLQVPRNYIPDSLLLPYIH